MIRRSLAHSEILPTNRIQEMISPISKLLLEKASAQAMSLEIMRIPE